MMRQATMIAANVSSSSTISAPALDSAHSSTMYSMPESRPPEWLLHAGFQQIPYGFHRKIVLVRAGDGMDDAAEQDGQQADARAAQANRSLRTQEQQRAQRKQRKRQKQAAAADEAAREAVQPAQQRAVDGQQREKGQNAQSPPRSHPMPRGSVRRSPALRVPVPPFSACAVRLFPILVLWFFLQPKYRLSYFKAI